MWRDLRAPLWAPLWAEGLKLRRSRLPLVTAGAMVLAGSVGGFFMFVLQDVGRARSLGLLGTKAQLSGASADWTGYFDLTAQIVSIGGLLIFGLVTTWLFGREFSDRTLKDLLALPTSRAAIVAAKVVLGLVWSLTLTGLLVVVTLAAGTLLGLRGWNTDVAVHGIGGVVVAAGLTAVLAVGYGLVASLGRGYLPAFGAMLGTLLAAQVASALGYGRWLPWAVPSLMSGAAGPDQTHVGAVGVIGVLVVGVAGAVATAAWWTRADQPA